MTAAAPATNFVSVGRGAKSGAGERARLDALRESRTAKASGAAAENKFLPEGGQVFSGRLRSPDRDFVKLLLGIKVAMRAVLTGGFNRPNGRTAGGRAGGVLVACALLAVACQSLARLAPAAAQVNGREYERLERAAESIRRGQLAQAEAELAAALRARPADANALNLLGVVRAEQRRDAEAEELFMRAVKVAPALVGAYLNLGRLYLAGRKTERALWAFERADELSPGRAEVSFNLAALYAERRDYERALTRLAEVPHDAADAELTSLRVRSHLAFAESLLRKGDLARAEENYAAALALRPEDPDTLRGAARAARARGEYEKALSHLVRARKLAPESAPVLYDFAWTALRLNLLFDALAVLEPLHRANPDEAGYLYALSIARLQNGERERARDLITRYVTLRPQDAAGHYVLGATLYGMKQYAPARAALERSVELAPYPDAEYYLGLIAHEEGDAERASGWLQRAIKSDPAHAGAHAALGVILIARKDYAAARDALERAVKLDPTHTKAHYQLGLAYARLGQQERARQMFALSEKLRAEQESRETTGLRLVEPPEKSSERP